MLIWLKFLKKTIRTCQRNRQRCSCVGILAMWLIKCGTMCGAMLNADKKTVYVQEGRLGYEEYAAKGFSTVAYSYLFINKARTICSNAHVLY